MQAQKCRWHGGLGMTEINKDRIRLKSIQDRELFAEVDGKCPLCGDSLVSEKDGRRIAVYDRAHIYPHSPTTAQLLAFKGIPKPIDIESPANIILLCKRCHKMQDDATTATDLLRLYSVKQEKSGAYHASQEMSRINIEPELRNVLDTLSTIDDSDLVVLSYNPLAIKRKIEAGALQRKVLGCVTTYYETLKRLFQELDNRRSSTFEMIAMQVKQAFLSQERGELFLDKSQVFDVLVEWVQSKTGGCRVACEAVVSYFVQDCEVFHEISK
jgi:hypothetical protein